MAQEQQEPTRLKKSFEWRHRWTLRLVLVAVGVSYVTLFAAANFVHIELRLIFWEGEVRVSWIGLGALAIGFAIGLISGRLTR